MVTNVDAEQIFTRTIDMFIFIVINNAETQLTVADLHKMSKLCSRSIFFHWVNFKV